MPTQLNYHTQPSPPLFPRKFEYAGSAKKKGKSTEKKGKAKAGK